MNDNNEPARSLEKVYHFFLTGETPLDQNANTSVHQRVEDEKKYFNDNKDRQQAGEYGRIENTVAQLYVLRDSCKGMYHTGNPDNDIIWFQGAASILQDAITNLIKTLRFLGKNP